MSTGQDDHVAFIGFGELAHGLVKGLKTEGLVHIKVYDKLMNTDSETGKMLRNDAKALEVTIAERVEDLVPGTDIIFSTVTPKNALVVARGISGHLRVGVIYADLNSCTPNLKKQCEDEITRTGADYVDVGVVGGISLQGHRIPCVICGPKAVKLKERMSQYGMNMEVVNAPVGTAALIKMLRSVVLKGIEALMLEMFMAAREYGLEDAMMKSIAGTFNRGDFEKYSGMLMTTHGLHAGRRCDETEMILETIKDVGVSPYVTEGIYKFFANSAKLNMPAYFQGTLPGGYKDVAKAIKELSGKR